jgi:hypothetical protein
MEAPLPIRPGPRAVRRTVLWLAIAPAAALVVVGWLTAHCIESSCVRDLDCTSGQVCDESTGNCVTGDCSTDEDCGSGRVCEDHFCVAGCNGPEDCDADQRCWERRCVEVGVECECPLAPDFCKTDLNPASATSGEDICVPDSFPEGALIFFGSIRCGHCQAIFQALRVRKAALEAEGLHPKLLWLQLESVPVTSADVAGLLPDSVDPLVLDTAAENLWGAYAAGWYHVVTLDSHGCLTGHWGPVTPTDVQGSVGEDMVAKWRSGMSPECPEPYAETTDAGETSPETIDGGETLDTAEAFDVPPDVEEVSEGTSDVGEPADATPEVGAE